jgi:hypothetical protein
VNALIARIDVNAVVERVDLNEALDQVDMDKLMARVDINKILDRIDIDTLVTGKTEREIIAEAEEEFERRAAADDPAGFVPHGRPPRGRAQVYSVRIPPDALAALRRLAEARGQLPSVLIRGWVLERLRQETTGEELLVSRDELARIVREQVEAALRRAS